MPARFSNLDKLPQWSPNNHGQSAQLERPAPPDAVGDQPTKQTSNKCASQTHAHHKSCTRNRWPSSPPYTTKQIIITQTQNCESNADHLPPTCSRWTRDPAKCSRAAHSQPCNERSAYKARPQTRRRKKKTTIHSTHPRWYPNKKEDTVAIQTWGKDGFQDGLPMFWSIRFSNRSNSRTTISTH